MNNAEALISCRPGAATHLRSCGHVSTSTDTHTHTHTHTTIGYQLIAV